MKIISLNTWHSKLRDELRAYIAAHLDTTDVFCFQEASQADRQVYADLLEANFHCFTAEHFVSDSLQFANTFFVRNTYVIDDHKVVFEPSEVDPELGMATSITLEKDGKRLIIYNVHGTPKPANKLDSPGRLRQTELLLENFAFVESAVFIGDFNLLPETRSIRLFSEHGFNDLIKEYKIPTTRNRITFEAYPDSIQYYADYAFTASVTVDDFVVPDTIVSDHQPLELEIRF